MAVIRKRRRRDGSIAFQAIVRRAGYPERTETFDDERKARDWATMIEGSMIEGRHFRGSEGKRRTLADAIDRYIEFEVPKKRDGEMHSTTLKWWKKQLGQTKLADLTRPTVRQYRDKLLKVTHRGRPLSNARVNRYVACLRHLFTVAISEWEWATFNPAKGIKPLPEGQGRIRSLSDEERQALLAETAKDATLHLFVLIALSTACRAGELQRLEWRDVDLKAGRLLFRKTKNEQPRTAWISGTALNLLKEHAKVRKLKGGLVFESQATTKRRAKGERLYDYHRPFRAAVDAAGIVDFRFHDLRHSAATYLAQAGATEQQLKAIGGWKSNIVSRYVHLAAEDAKAALEKLAERVEK